MRRIAVVVSIASLAISVACGTTAEDQTVATPPPDYGESPSGTGKAAEINDHGTETFTDAEFELEFELDNFYFEPTFIKSPGDGTATLKMHNEGDVQHNFSIDALRIDEDLAPGEERTVIVEIGTESRYDFYCKFHEGEGMRGAFQPH
jgi:plastocyanin